LFYLPAKRPLLICLLQPLFQNFKRYRFLIRHDRFENYILVDYDFIAAEKILAEREEFPVRGDDMTVEIPDFV
jgi:hypothetical protein